MLTKIFIIFIMLIIAGALMSGLIFLVKDDSKTKRPIKSLTLRISLSLALFIFLFLAYLFHWIAPHNL